jgi:5-deoxy-glucuronate isomerase
MSSLRVRPKATDSAGKILEITPQSASWKYVGFSVVRRTAHQKFAGLDPSREICLVFISGTARVSVGGEVFEQVGSRATPFDDSPPGAVYVPMATRFEIDPDGEIEVAICSAPGAKGYAPRLIAAEAMPVEVRGEGTNKRYIRNILPQTRPAHSLIVVEVITPGGHWSSYPPHKHDTPSTDVETALEEIYYHRINPSQGFAVQRVYTDDRSIDELVLVEDRDLVLVPKGYHPVGAAHGYDLYYLNVMAGPAREWIFRNDPEHEWMLGSSGSSVTS